ncbi:hypothetical protein Q8F55_007181 [Vanrija albida]|uniref:Ribosomal protein S21 n=1 Tax=Vanrija albida TaxID=181172 RepID=A0ABR3PZL5_9TREE
MAFLFRTAVARAPLTAPRLALPLAPRAAPLAFAYARFNSTFPSSPSSSLPSSSTDSPSDPLSAPEPAPEPILFNTAAPSSDPSRIALPDASHLVPDLPNADAWWRASTLTAGRAFPGTRFSGRSLPVRSGNMYSQTYQNLAMRLSVGNVRKDFKRFEYHETAAKRRVRLRSERHRRRFKEEVRQRVQQVQMLRARK